MSSKNLKFNEIGISQHADWIIDAYCRSGVKWHSDTQEQLLDLSQQEDALHSVILAILYAFTVPPKAAEESLKYLQNVGVLRIQELAEIGNQLSWTKHDNEIIVRLAPELVEALDKSYRRIPRLMAVAILRALSKLATDFDLDPRTIFARVNYDPKAVIDTLGSWKARLLIKSFWLAREMRMQRIWVDPTGELVSGEICCVVDIQVRRALEHLGANLRGLSPLEISNAIWLSYQELYDFPLLWFGRNHCSTSPTNIECPLGEKCPYFERRLL